jgi:alpha-galactosidase
MPSRALLEPVKLAVTPWNCFYDTFTRALQLHHAVNAYAKFHIERTKADDIYARSRNNQLPRVSTWMRSDGLIAADWAVIYDYIQVLQPLKKANY